MPSDARGYFLPTPLVFSRPHTQMLAPAQWAVDVQGTQAPQHYSGVVRVLSTTLESGSLDYSGVVRAHSRAIRETAAPGTAHKTHSPRGVAGAEGAAV